MRILSPWTEDSRTKDPQTKNQGPRFLNPRTEDPRIKDPRIEDPRIEDPVHGLEFCPFFNHTNNLQTTHMLWSHRLGPATGYSGPTRFYITFGQLFLMNNQEIEKCFHIISDRVVCWCQGALI